MSCLNHFEGDRLSGQYAIRSIRSHLRQRVGEARQVDGTACHARPPVELLAVRSRPLRKLSPKQEARRAIRDVRRAEARIFGRAS